MMLLLERMRILSSSRQLNAGLFTFRFVGNQMLVARLPVDWAQTAGLQSLQHAKRLVHAASDIVVVHDLVLHFAFRIDDEETAKRYAFLFD